MVAAVAGGCGMVNKSAPKPGPHDTQASYHDSVGLQIAYPEVNECMNEAAVAARETLPPLVDEDPSKLPTYDLTLAEAVQMAVRQSPVIRDLGGTFVNTPNFATTVYDPSLAHSNPAFGVEAALAAFDAQYDAALFWNKADVPNNVQVLSPGGQFTPSVFQGTTGNFRNELSKRTAQGGRFALRQITIYDNNNRPFRQFTSDFVGWVEAEWRQPLMRGAGTEFNRIVGTSQFPGQYNGVLIARVNEDVALADFEAAIIRLVNDVEQAYWELSVGYRFLEATLRGRESALRTFHFEDVRLEVGKGRVDLVAQTESQFYQFQAQVEAALSGELGLYAREQRLRYLLGLPSADGRLIKPITPPTDTKVVFDWESAVSQALQRRVEIRRQRFNLKRRELELYAAQLNRRPQLDFLGTYRVRGLGDNLIGSNSDEPLGNLVGEIAGGDYQEWQAGLEMTFPVGLRAASNAVAHARLSLNRERALLNETELRISHSLADAVRRIGLTHSLLMTNYNSLNADLRQVKVLEARTGLFDDLDVLLLAQRQLVNSELSFYRSLSDYNLAIRDLHREKGSLLAYNGVTLAEGPWAADAYPDAYELGRFLSPRQHPETVSQPPSITSGPFDPSQPQNTQSMMGMSMEGLSPMLESSDSEAGQPSPDAEPDPVPSPSDRTTRMPRVMR